MMQSFIKTEFSSNLNDTSNTNTSNSTGDIYQTNILMNKEKLSSSQGFGSLICRKRLDFDAVDVTTSQSFSSPSTSTTPSQTISLSDKTRHNKSSKKNTAIVAGTVQAHSALKHQKSQDFFSSHDTNSLKSNRASTHSNNGQQYVKVPSNTKRNARERKRVRTINDYFSKLQKYLPYSKPPPSSSSSSSNNTSSTPTSHTLSSNASKKLSKVETLKAAIDYIEYLLTFAPACRYNNSGSSSVKSQNNNNMNMNAAATVVASLTPCASSASPSSLSTSASSPSSSILSSPSSCFSSSMSSSSSNSLSEKPVKCSNSNSVTKSAPKSSACSSPSSSVLTLMNKSLKSLNESSMTPSNSSTLSIASSSVNYECSNINNNNTNSNRNSSGSNFYPNQSNSYQLSASQPEFNNSGASNINNYGSYHMDATAAVPTSEPCYYTQQYVHPSQTSFPTYLPNETAAQRMVVDMHVYTESPLNNNNNNSSSCSPLSTNAVINNRHITPGSVSMVSPNHHQFIENNQLPHHHHSLNHGHHHHHHHALQNPYNNTIVNSYHAAPEIYYN